MLFQKLYSKMGFAESKPTALHLHEWTLSTLRRKDNYGSAIAVLMDTKWNSADFIDEVGLGIQVMIWEEFNRLKNESFAFTDAGIRQAFSRNEVKCGIYFIFGESPRSCYIGISRPDSENTVRDRIRKHLGEKNNGSGRFRHINKFVYFETPCVYYFERPGIDCFRSHGYTVANTQKNLTSYESSARYCRERSRIGL